MAYLDWLWKIRPVCREWTRRFFGVPGLNVPGVCTLEGAPMGGWAQYSYSGTISAWLAHHFYLHWKYSGDETFLRERAYPYLQEVAIFLENLTRPTETGNPRSLRLSSSPEFHHNELRAWFPTVTNYDLALILWLFAAVAEIADTLGLNDEAASWRAVRNEFPELAVTTDSRLLVAAECELEESHRHLSHLLALYPLELIRWEEGGESRRIFDASVDDFKQKGTDQWNGYTYAWLAVLEARRQNGAEAERLLEIFSTAFTLRNSFHCNGDQSGKGYSSFTFRPFTLEGNFAAADAIQKMLIQSTGGIIRFFPAVPAHWEHAAFSGFRTEGAFLVSASWEAGKVIQAEIRADQSRVCQFICPFTGLPRSISLAAGESLVLQAD